MTGTILFGVVLILLAVGAMSFVGYHGYKDGSTPVDAGIYILGAFFVFLGLLGVFVE